MLEGIIAIDSARGVELGFTSANFLSGSYLWEEPNRILISFIFSQKPGAFRKLVETILAQGKDVCVPTPVMRMRSIVEKNGYVKSIESTVNGPCEMWTLKASPAPVEV